MAIVELKILNWAKFKIDLIVWKLDSIIDVIDDYLLFKIDLIVWKL